MTEQKPDGLYIYQPYGPASDPDRVESKRFYGVGGVDTLAEIKGLTKAEAKIVAEALRTLEVEL